ncbi:MAG: hypothetical protein IAA72_08695 [Spirochaetes bacterium]|uniref:Uncharacterized protein n=1 Tax=Candidatus Ornithospirochaeta stercoravium TaxID=2840897 RepID=A0A9D9NDT7_9SPIO|nr:hypothetical protein [Candidatus Ornithospirochaeta stercoravium]
MTHSELISVGWFIAEFIMRQYLVGRSDMLITYEPGMVSLPESPDIIALSKKFRLKEPSVVVECKATRADFLKDRKKPFRVYPDKGMGMFRAYVTNPGIAMEGEVPEGWLLYEVFEDGAVYMKHGRNPNGFYEFARNSEAEFIMYRYIQHWLDKGYGAKIPEPLDVPIHFIDRAEYMEKFRKEVEE